MTDPERVVALVIGASRGVGRGIAASLADAGLRVFASGRTIDNAEVPASVVRVASSQNRNAGGQPGSHPRLHTAQGPFVTTDAAAIMAPLPTNGLRNAVRVTPGIG